MEPDEIASGIDGGASKLREALDYIAFQLARAERLCEEIRKLDAVLESAREDLRALEARRSPPTLEDLQRIVEKVDRAQTEWEDFAVRLAELWAPGGAVH